MRRIFFKTTIDNAVPSLYISDINNGVSQMKVVQHNYAHTSKTDSSIREAIETAVRRAGSERESGQLETMRAEIAKLTEIVGVLTEALLAKSVDRAALVNEIIPYGFDVELDE